MSSSETSSQIEIIQAEKDTAVKQIEIWNEQKKELRKKQKLILL